MKSWSVISPRSRVWLLQNLALGTKKYWFTFIADSITALVLLGLEIADPATSFGAIGLATVAGFLAWGFTEYAFHRWIYHNAASIFTDGHTLHHQNPEVLLAMPWFLTTMAMAAVWWLGDRVLGLPYFAAFQAGWLVGFVWYSVVHHVHHHSRANSLWLRRLKAYHKVHHQFPGRNYGVTMVFWDRVFQTRYRPPARRAASTHAQSEITATAIAEEVEALV
jgi:sterol desaturase/sphingolipid hydroxylase (fatty acid hydroxylase superfamily)